jgi:PAS domain-containing protein
MSEARGGFFRRRLRGVEMSTWALTAGVLAALCLARLYSYLLFHGAVELFTVAVAWSMFFLAWNARHRLDNHYILFLAVASFPIGAVDIAHTLAYRGMGVLGANDGNLPTQLWVAGRYLQTAAFLLAPLYIRRRLDAPAALAVWWAAALLLMAAALYGGILPDCFVEGSGLTPFKVFSEYALTALLLAAMWQLWRRRAAFDRAVAGELTGALALMAAGGLSFTLYADVYGVANMVGHLLRYLAYWLLCRAVIVTGLVRPYDLLFRNLSLSEERYRAFVAASTEGICRIELEEPLPLAGASEHQAIRLAEGGRVAESNATLARVHGRPDAAAMTGARLADLLAPCGREGMELLRAFLREGALSAGAELALEAGEDRRDLEVTLTGVLERGRLVRVWLVERDVTERNRAAAERERLAAERAQALAEVQTLSGLLPICAHCKKIRDDQGYWTRVETYIQRRTRASFSHGICPACVKEHYGDLVDPDNV